MTREVRTRDASYYIDDELQFSDHPFVGKIIIKDNKRFSIISVQTDGALKGRGELGIGGYQGDFDGRIYFKEVDSDELRYGPIEPYSTDAQIKEVLEKHGYTFE